MFLPNRLDESRRGHCGLPSAIAAAEARAITAEERYENESGQTMELARVAALRREVFAARVGTWVKRLTTAVLLVAFLTATGLTYLATGVPVVPRSGGPGSNRGPR